MKEQEPRLSTLASRLRMAREQAGLSQGQVAKLMGLHRPSVSEAEAGRRRVTTEELTKLADIYGVDLQWLASGARTEQNDRIELAARELAKLKPEDVERLMGLLGTLRRGTEGDA